jgi:hypothetical protein
MRRAILTILLFVAPTLSTGQSDARVVKPEIRVGDSWTYRGVNLLGPGTQDHVSRVSYVDDKVILLVSTRRSDGKEFDSSWTSEWNAVTSYSGRMFRPHTGLFRFPLLIGDRYETKGEWLEPRKKKGIDGAVTGSVKVVGWEAVEVPAGKFRAVRLETEFVIHALDGRAPQFKGSYWYVPEVRRWVRMQVIGPGGAPASEELLEYKLNED